MPKYGMIVSDYFVIGHIPKTGGDAAKQIIKKMNLPGVLCDSITKKVKHCPASIRSSKPLVLTIRQLPSWIVSYFHEPHATRFYPECFRTDPQRYFSEWFDIEKGSADEFLKRQYHKPTIWLRQERLRQDIWELLSKHFELTSHHKSIVFDSGTKGPRLYDHCVDHWLNSRQIEELYNTNPLWKTCESEAYIKHGIIQRLA